ncbi:MAG TPA: hypothetical protein VGJ88_01800, partial [Thermoanaerobaculia bacterium]
ASIAFVAVACNTFIVSMTNKLWSDPPTLALFLLAFAFLVAPKASLRSVLFAAVLIALGIAFRYAMISALLLPLFVAWRMRIRWFPPLVGACAVVVLVAIASRVSGFRSLPLREDLHAFETLAAQILPSQMGIVGLLVVVAAVALSWRALPVAGVWLAGHVAFLFVAQSIAQPSFTLDLRILVLLYPAIVVLIAAAADKTSHRWMSACLSVMLAIASARALHGMVPHAAPFPNCVTREQLVSQLRETTFPSAERLSSNAQGIVWYALRRPVSVTPRAGETVIAVDPAHMCDGVVETTLPDVGRTRTMSFP